MPDLGITAERQNMVFGALNSTLVITDVGPLTGHCSGKLAAAATGEHRPSWPTRA